MKNSFSKNGLLYTISAVLLFSIAWSSCSKEKGAVPFQISNQSLFDLIEQSAGTGYYQNGNILPAAGNSPHNSFKLRFNSIALSALDSLGELPAGSIFPDSSLVVKEVTVGGSLSEYAVMYKHKGSWVWGEYRTNGDVIYSIGNKGAACISCHSEPINRDLTRTFDLH
ncbi:MAG: hypothetical protein M3R27_09735 [Bacteroidota bacterium]|nr:hypothetical protein [Bacteroidota bacterium]